MSHIRPAIAYDDAAIQRLLCELNPDAPNSRWTWDSARQGAKAFVATIEGRTVGVAFASYVDYGPTSYGMIDEMIVDSEARGQGIGSDLLAECCRWLSEQNLQVVFTSTSPQRQSFYERAGFKNCAGPWLYWSPR